MFQMPISTIPGDGWVAVLPFGIAMRTLFHSWHRRPPGRFDVPYGSCPARALNIPHTNKMIYAWVLPDVGDEWGHLEDDRQAHYHEYLNA